MTRQTRSTIITKDQLKLTTFVLLNQAQQIILESNLFIVDFYQDFKNHTKIMMKNTFN